MEVAHGHSLHSSPHSNLPETVTETDYKYSVPDCPQPQTTVHALHANDVESPIPAYNESEKPVSRPRKWSRWPLLLLYGILLAIIAGVIGGFIGKTIERNNHNNDASTKTRPSPASESTPSLSLSSSMSSSTPTPSNTATIFERTIPQPTSGCDSSAPYRSFKARSKFLDILYTTICGQGWLDYELTAISAATQSDCIESCSMYNAYKGTGDRSCVGGGFIPTWWNQTLAMTESGNMPYNCFLKTNTSGIARNDKKYEVIALCMEGECDNISG